MVAAQGKGYCRVTIKVYATVKAYRNQGIWLKNRVSFFRKLFNWLKILLWTRETGKRNWQLTLG